MIIYLVIGFILVSLGIIIMLLSDEDTYNIYKTINDCFEEIDMKALLPLLIISIILGLGAMWLPFLVCVCIYAIKELRESK